MRHTLLLVAALGLIAVAGPSALAQEQEQDKTSSQPATPTTSEPGTTPAPLPATYTQPAMPGQVVSPYAPAYPGTVTPCGGVMPSAHIPGTVMYGSQYPQYQPFAANGSFPQMTQYSQPGIQYAQPMMQYGQPATQYGQPTAMPVAGSVAGGVMAQPAQTGAVYTNGMTYQPYQTGMVYSNGMTYQPIQSGMVYTNGMAYQPGMAYTNGMTHQPGTVFQAGAMGAYSGQPVMLTGYTNGFVDSDMTTRPARRGLFGRRR